MGVSSRKNRKMTGAHKIGAAISGPRICGRKNYGHEAFQVRATHEVHIVNWNTGILEAEGARLIHGLHFMV